MFRLLAEARLEGPHPVLQTFHPRLKLEQLRSQGELVQSLLHRLFHRIEAFLPAVSSHRPPCGRAAEGRSTRAPGCQNLTASRLAAAARMHRQPQRRRASHLGAIRPDGTWPAPARDPQPRSGSYSRGVRNGSGTSPTMLTAARGDPNPRGRLRLHLGRFLLERARAPRFVSCWRRPPALPDRLAIRISSTQHTH